jgi:hypothetical protein
MLIEFFVDYRAHAYCEAINMDIAHPSNNKMPEFVYGY